jgi:hypothetical protein
MEDVGILCIWPFGLFYDHLTFLSSVSGGTIWLNGLGTLQSSELVVPTVNISVRTLSYDG